MHWLILLRHAKAAWPDSVDDSDRPLAARGEDDAAVVAGLFTDPRESGAPAPEALAPEARAPEARAPEARAPEGPAIPVPELVLCSPALRTRQTWAIAGAGLEPTPPVTYEPVIYGASIDEIIELVHGLPESATTALVVGHEPTMSRTTLALAGRSSSGPALASVRQKFPTSGIAVLAYDGLWTGLAPGTASLESFTVPRA